MSRRRRLLFMAAPTATVTVLLIVGGEVGLRIAYKKIERITGAAPWKTESWQDLTYFRDRYDETLGWSNLPGYRSDGQVPFRVTIDSQGLRAARDYGETPPVGTRRIAMVGDSTTFGEEVDDDETLPW